jgi:large subunit ribosomal protein L17
MRHRVAGRKLGRTTEHRIALLRNLSTALFDKEKITTTLAKAKELRPFAEKLVTLSKKETLHARRQVLRHIHNRAVVAKLFDTLSARYAQRPGGYTRIFKLGPRRGDHAEMAIIELVGAAESEEAAKPKKRKTSSKKAKTSKKKSGAKKKSSKTTKKAKTSKKKTADKPKTAKKKSKAKTKAKTKAKKAAKKAAKS